MFDAIIRGIAEFAFWLKKKRSYLIQLPVTELKFFISILLKGLANGIF